MKFLLIPLLLFSAAAAQEVPPEITKLREQLRATALQLRAAEVEKANALATFAASEAKNETLRKDIDGLNTKVTDLTKGRAEDTAATEKAIAGLNDRIIDREKRIKEFQEAIEKWKLAYGKVAQTAREKEGARAELANEKLILKNTIADRERKNLNLYKTSLEILERYENYSLGKALSAREPFIKKTRVTIENQVQDYKDAIIDNRISAQPK